MSSSKIFYISDLHLNHNAIIRFCNRPFKDTAEMDRELIRRWNDVVGEGDTVYFLGDFSFSHNKDENLAYFQALKGNKFLVIGNHDNDATIGMFGYKKTFHYHEVKDDGRKIVLCHYPIISWNGLFKNALHFYGHVHDKSPEAMPANSFNMCVEKHDYTPRTLSEILEGK